MLNTETYLIEGEYTTGVSSGSSLEFPDTMVSTGDVTDDATLLAQSSTPGAKIL